MKKYSNNKVLLDEILILLNLEITFGVFFNKESNHRRFNYKKIESLRKNFLKIFYLYVIFLLYDTMLMLVDKFPSLIGRNQLS